MFFFKSCKTLFPENRRKVFQSFCLIYRPGIPPTKTIFLQITGNRKDDSSRDPAAQKQILHRPEAVEDKKQLPRITVT